jgi:hypothetical protein
MGRTDEHGVERLRKLRLRPIRSDDQRAALRCWQNEDTLDLIER